MPYTILTTGGAGYIGSHVSAALMAEGYEVVILDDFSNSAEDVPHRLARMGVGRPELVRGDVRDRALLHRVFSERRIDAVIHLAGLKAVGGSVTQPLLYYHVNVGGAVALLEAMMQHGVMRLIFSSSATVYGEPKTIPIAECAALWTTNPYAQTKLVIERIVSDLAVAQPGFAAVSLRYFNPVGAHPSAIIGEDPMGEPNNLFPYIAQAAAGLRTKVRVFGRDYPTQDGSGVRDYIHVMDLAEGHVAALDHIIWCESMRGRHLAVNLGRGTGVSVLEAIAAFSRAAGRNVPFEVVARRAGDVPELVADPRLAEQLFGWKARRSVEEMCGHHWAFQCQRLAVQQATLQKQPSRSIAAS